MELPKWAFKAESSVKSNGSIDMVFRLRLLGRLWLYACALLELARTATITITIEFQEQRPIVSHDGERIEPTRDYTLQDSEVEDLVKRVPIPKIPLLIDLARERQIFGTPRARREA
jgi:hypothetical protein